MLHRSRVEPSELAQLKYKVHEPLLFNKHLQQLEARRIPIGSSGSIGIPKYAHWVDCPSHLLYCSHIIERVSQPSYTLINSWLL